MEAAEHLDELTAALLFTLGQQRVPEAQVAQARWVTDTRTVELQGVTP